MSILLLQACSASKKEPNGSTPAIDLYSGYFYKIINKSKRENEFRSDVDLAILSAKYGILDPSEEIEWYDKHMNQERAQELNSTVVESIKERVREEGYDKVVINMGAVYRKAVTGLGQQIDAALAEIQGSGIGEKGNALYWFLRGDDSVVRSIKNV